MVEATRSKLVALYNAQVALDRLLTWDPTPATPAAPARNAVARCAAAITQQDGASTSLYEDPEAALLGPADEV